MAHYLTRQRRLLLDYLAQHPDEALSALKIAADLAPHGISASAVYRNLSALEEGNQLCRIGVNDSGEILYQYMGAEHCRGSLHFTCTQCKKTTHLKESTAYQLLALIEEQDQCLISKEQTVLYGLCKNCR